MTSLPNSEEMLELLEIQDKKITTLRSQIEQLNSVKSQQEKQIDELLSLNETKLSNKLKTDNRHLTTQVEKLKTENQSLNTDIADLRSSINSLRYRAQQAEKEQRVEYVYKDKIVTEYEFKCTVCTQEIYSKKVKELERLQNIVKAKKLAHETFIGFLLLYCFLTTIFSATRMSSILSDFSSFISNIANFCLGIFKVAKWGILEVSKLGDMIPQRIVAVIVHWLIIIVLTMILILLILGALYFGGLYFFRIFVEPSKDNITYGFALISFATLVCFADGISALIGFNLIWLYIITLLLFFVLRIAISKGVEIFEEHIW